MFDLELIWKFCFLKLKLNVKCEITSEDCKDEYDEGEEVLTDLSCSRVECWSVLL